LVTTSINHKYETPDIWITLFKYLLSDLLDISMSNVVDEEKATEEEIRLA